MSEMGLQVFQQGLVDSSILAASIGRSSALPLTDLGTFDLGKCSQLDFGVRRHA